MAALMWVSCVAVGHFCPYSLEKYVHVFRRCKASGQLWWKLGDTIPDCLSIIHNKFAGLPFLFFLETDKTKMVPCMC